MKKTTILFSVVLFATNLYAQQNYKMVQLNFKDPIEGFTINVNWQPLNYTGDGVTGAAIINMYNVKTKKTSIVTNNHFYVSKENLPFTYGKDKAGEDVITDYGTAPINLVNNNVNSLESDYEVTLVDKNKNNKLEAKELQSTYGKNSYFKFIDVNFDGQKDLLLVEDHNGQRGIHAYKTHILKDGECEQDMYNLGNDVPLNKLDEYSAIDAKNKTITLNYACGASCVYKEIYKIMGDKYNEKFELVADVISDDTTNKIYKTTYSYKKGIKKIVSKVEVKE